jgi:hypothetical protein
MFLAGPAQATQVPITRALSLNSTDIRWSKTYNEPSQSPSSPKVSP